MRGYGVGVSAGPTVIGRIVTSTITLICVLIVYDRWATLKLLDAIGIVAGPVLAIFVSHVFASSLVQQVHLARRPTWHEWLTTVRFESRFLLLALPPIALLAVLDLANVPLGDGVRLIIWLEALSLTFWAGVAAHRAGLRRWSLALALLAGLVVSGIVVVIQVALQPGKAVEGGVAAPSNGLGVEPSRRGAATPGRSGRPARRA